MVIDSVSMILLRYGTARTFQLLGELRHLFGIENQGMDRSESSTSSANTMLTSTNPSTDYAISSTNATFSYTHGHARHENCPMPRTNGYDRTSVLACIDRLQTKSLSNSKQTTIRPHNVAGAPALGFLYLLRLTSTAYVDAIIHARGQRRGRTHQNQEVHPSEA